MHSLRSATIGQLRLLGKVFLRMVRAQGLPMLQPRDYAVFNEDQARKIQPSHETIRGAFSMTEREILDILKREIRLVSFGGDPCQECGDTVGYSFRVKEGCLERIAKLLSDGESAQVLKVGELPQETVDRLKTAKMDPRHVHLNKLLDGTDT